MVRHRRNLSETGMPISFHFGEAGMTIEAHWAVNFSTPFGSFDSGVVVFGTGRIFGTASLYYNLGDYVLTGTVASGKVEVVHYSGL
jgi:hypothetical protein